MAKKHCEHCGASMVVYKRNFSRDLARCIYRMAKAGGRHVDVSSLGLTNAQYSNFGRMHFWGLIEREENEDGSGKGGVWSLTQLGWRFVTGEIKIPKYVHTYRAKVVEQGSVEISIQDITDGWWYKPKVIRESQPYEPQLSLIH